MFEVSVLLSGMSFTQQVVEYLDSADCSGTGLLSEVELILIDKVREKYRRLVPALCTNCKYCMPCPRGVEITAILEYYNDAIIHDNSRAPRFLYRIEL